MIPSRNLAVISFPLVSPWPMTTCIDLAFSSFEKTAMNTAMVMINLSPPLSIAFFIPSRKVAEFIKPSATVLPNENK